MPSEKERRPRLETESDAKSLAEGDSSKYRKPVNSRLLFALLSGWDMSRAEERLRTYAADVQRRHAATRRAAEAGGRQESPEDKTPLWYTDKTGNLAAALVDRGWRAPSDDHVSLACIARCQCRVGARSRNRKPSALIGSEFVDALIKAAA